MKYTMFSLLISIAFFQCKKKQEPYIPIQKSADLTRNIDTIRKYILGNWNWQQEKRLNRETSSYDYLTPKTEGYTLKLKLSGDTASFYKNDYPDSVYRFQILREQDITSLPEDTLPVIAYFRLSTGVRKFYVPIKICKDQLLMQHQFVT